MGAIVQKQEIFMEMDRRDQQQIVLAATGEVVEDLVYTVKGKDRLSWAGVNHVCYMMGDVKVDPWVKEELIEMFGRKFRSATVRAINERYNLASLGTAEVPEMMEVHILDENDRWAKNEDGSWKMELKEDHFCRRKALSMAQRNAKSAVIPAAMIVKWIQYFKALKRGEKPETPFKPKVVESEYKVVEKKETSKQPPRPTKRRKPESATPGQLTLGKVDLKTIEYNIFDALRVPKEAVDVFEQADGFIIEPITPPDEELRSAIYGTLKPMGAIWEEKGPLGRWRIPKGG